MSSNTQPVLHVSAVIVAPDGSTLLLRRLTPDVLNNNGKLTTLGTDLLWGETMYQALKRLFRDNLGYNYLEAHGLDPIVEHINTLGMVEEFNFINDEDEIPNFHRVSFTWLVNISDTDLIDLGFDADAYDANWYMPKEISHLDLTSGTRYQLELAGLREPMRQLSVDDCHDA